MLSTVHIVVVKVKFDFVLVHKNGVLQYCLYGEVHL